MQELTIDHNKPCKVNTICCYVCGREFGTKGFAFHYKECLVKYSNEQNNKLPKDRVKLPDAPEDLKLVLAGDFSSVDLKKLNQLSNHIFKYKVLPACKYCKRTFNPQSLATHMKGCPKKPLGVEEKENDIQPIVKVPKNLVCCVCGQRFGTASLRIHYPQCVKKFNNEEFRKHKREADRRRPPEFTTDELEALKKTDWTDQQMEDFNDRAMQKYRHHGMAECDNCGRKFFFQQYDKHCKNCQLINGKLNLGKPKSQESNAKAVAKPKVIVCFICGRQYGLSSISIHMPQCEEMFKKQQEGKAVGDRKKMPRLSEQAKASFDLSNAEEWSRKKLEQYNKIAFQCFNKRSLSKCYICQRTFFEEQLPKHLKDCESKIKDVKKFQKFKKDVNSKKGFFGDNFIDNVIQMNKQLNAQKIKEAAKPRVLMCLLCGRQFGLSSLKIHTPQCRAHSSSKKAQLAAVMEAIQEKYDINEAPNWDQAKIDEYNREVYGIYKNNSLFECKYCHRTFFEQSLKKHIKHCEKEQTKKKGFRRSQTLNLLHSQEIKSAQPLLDMSVNLIKMSSDKPIIEESGCEQTEPAQDYFKILNSDEEIDECAFQAEPDAKVTCQEVESAGLCSESAVEVISNTQLLEIFDF